MMTLESSDNKEIDLSNAIISTIKDPDALNVGSIANDIKHSRYYAPEELSYRALPLIVSTSELYQDSGETYPIPVTITKKNFDQLWDYVTKMRIQQEVNETGTCYEMVGNARILIETLSGLNPNYEKEANLMNKIISVLVLIYDSYINLRPNRKQLLKKYFTQRHLNHSDID